MSDASSQSRRGLVERLMRRDQTIVLVGTGLIVCSAAIYTIAGVGMNMSALEMTQMAQPIGRPMGKGMVPEWTPAFGILVFLMWWIMMIAMMMPSAAPALLLYTAVKRMGPDSASATLLSGYFLAGYLIAWAGFSLTATFAQWLLETANLSNGMMMTINSQTFAGVVLLFAGIYQFSSLKHACLRHCQSPAEFIARHNYPGRTGTLKTGLHHGAYCVGCCWALMALLFVGGIMNLYWIAGIAIYVAIEKLLPSARWIPYLFGSMMIIFALYLLVGSFL